MQMFVNTSGFPFNTTRQRPDGRIFGGTVTDITSHPYQVWSLGCRSIWRSFEVFEQNRESVFVITKSFSSKHIKNRQMNSAVAVCNSGGIVDWTEGNWWFCGVICCFVNCIAVSFNPYPTAFPYGNGMVLHFYKQQESSTTKTVHKVINKGLKTYV